MRTKIEKLTRSQEILCEKLDAFKKRPIVSGDLSSRVFLLTGRAGTGKSSGIYYSLEEDIKHDLKNDFGFIFGGMGTPRVVGVAPSHKAKNVLKGSIPFVKTFASCYGLKRVENIDGSVDFKRNKKKNHFEQFPCELRARFFVFDEVSMINRKMLNYILNETNIHSKIILMGDRGQLPPIEGSDEKYKLHPDADSPVFDLQLEESSKHELTEIVRQTDGNPIVQMSSVIYEEIFGNKDRRRVYATMKNEIFDESTGIGFNTVFLNDFLHKFKEEDYTKTKVTAYRRFAIDHYNNQIRQHILNYPTEEFIPGELIYMDDTFMKSKSKDLDSGFTLYNSDEYKLDDVIEDTENGVLCKKLMLNTEGHDHLAGTNYPYAPIPTGEGIIKYNKELELLRERALDPLNKDPNRWSNFYIFKDSFARVSYGYAYTGHKIQGSSYKNIYVDVNDIFSVGPISMKRKLQALYTAVTRASHKVSLIKTG